MVFVKRKRESFGWGIPKHLTEIWIRNIGEASINQRDLVKHAKEFVDFIMRSAGIENYRIVWLQETTETYEDVVHIYELPAWHEIEALGCAEVEPEDVLACLEKKLGKKYLFIRFVNIPAYIAVEILK